MWIYISILIVILFFLKKFFNGPFAKHRKNMEGKIVIITGASAGLGKETAFQLLEDGAEVIFATRDEKKTLKILDELDDSRRKRAKFVKLDLNSFEDVNNFSEYIKANYPKVDILMNNAGLFPAGFSLTKDNIESTFQANHLSHKLLTFLLLDHLDKKEGKIINLSSYAHFFSDYSLKKVEDLVNQESFEYYRKIYFNGVLSMNLLYADTKLHNVYFTQYLAEYLEKNYPNIKTVSIHPGTVRTEFLRFIQEGSLLKYVYYLILPMIYLIFKSPIAGAQTQLECSYLDNSQLVSGGYYQDCRVTKISPIAADDKIRIAFINYSWKVLNKFVKPEIMKKVILK